MTAPEQLAPQGTRKRIRTLAEVEAAHPTALAMMTRAQVDALRDGPRARRVEIMLGADHVMWGLPHLMAWTGLGRATVARWRLRQSAGDEVNGVRTVLPPPVPGNRPCWPMPELLRWRAALDGCDRIDYVPFPGGRKRPGRIPDSIKAVMGVAPSQQPTGRPRGRPRRVDVQNGRHAQPEAAQGRH